MALWLGAIVFTVGLSGTANAMGFDHNYNFERGEIRGAVKAFNMTMGYKMERVAPVPEPEVYALLISDMALVAGIARRRRKSS